MDDPYVGEKFDCDVVMKGGITSGVVYPGAIDALARDFRFRAIGGTSAGAIAAAIVAAAEHRRQRPGGGTAGFARVAGLPAALGAKRGRKRQLMALFQPDKATRGVFRILSGFLALGALPVVGRFAKWLALPLAWLAFPLWVAAGAALVVVAVLADLDPVVAWVAGTVGVLVLVLGPPARIVRTVIRLPDNGFGLCRLGPGSVGKGPALTEWLHEQIQLAAGREPGGPVLTFGDLWGIDPALTDPAERREEALKLCRDVGRRTVDLQMMTTDLTHGLPMRLPSAWHRDGDSGDTEMDDGGGLVFDPEELRGYFPAAVVEHLCARGGPIGRRADMFPKAWRRFPLADDLPVVVAARMSLSFPVLIAAIPLWDYDYARDARKRVWFSDGGISSNFPVHFFDAPLPRWPTFGLNLTALPRDAEVPSGVEAQEDAVGDLPDVNSRAHAAARDIDGLAPFLTAIKDAMQNWRDNLQALQPGYRDRVVPVMLGKGEGGMALNMGPEKIADLSARGGAAGRRLADRFAVDDAGAHTGWNDHRLARLRITMASVEPFMESFERGWTDPPCRVGARTRAATMSYTARIAAADVKPYKMTGAQITRAPTVADAYCATLKAGGDTSLQPGAPRPRSVTRVVPPT